METDGSSAQTITSGPCGTNATYNIYTDGTLEITGSGDMYQYDTTPAPWYDCRDDITKITIDDKITKLGASAFLGCKNVTELTLPITLNSVISDKSPAFASCSCVEKINFTSGNGGYGYNYAAYPVSNSWYQNTPWYQSRTVLKEINFADDVKAIGSDTFRELNITSIVLPDSVVHLGNHCFFNCTKLTDLTLPVSLNSFGSNEKYPAFNGCMAVQKVTFTKGNGVPYDYANIWHDNSKLAPWNMNSDIAKTIVISDNIIDLGTGMFRMDIIKELTIPLSIDLEFCRAFTYKVEYTNLEKVTLTQGIGKTWNWCSSPNGTKNINCPWYHAPNLRTVIVAEGVTYLGNYAFYQCNLDDLVLPNSLTSLGECPFDSTTIKHLTIPISLDPIQDNKDPAFKYVSGIEKIDFIPGSGHGFDYVAYDASYFWQHHVPWYQLTPWHICKYSLKEINFAEGITHIGSDAFRDLRVTSLVIPNSVESLGCHAFYNMTWLTSLTIPITLDSVGSTKYPAFDQVDTISELRFTTGTNGIGHDYSDVVPSWNYSHDNNFTVTFDRGIEYIGTNTLSAFIFADADGQRLDPTAAHLSGRTFQGSNSQWQYLIGDLQDQSLKASLH